MRPIDAFAYSHSLYFDWAVAEFPGDVLRVLFRLTEIHAVSIDEFKLIQCSVEATSSTISGDQRSTAEDPVWRLRRYATLCKSKWIGELQKMRCYFKISFPSVLGWRISRNPPSSFAPSQSSVRALQRSQSLTKRWNSDVRWMLSHFQNPQLPGLLKRLSRALEDAGDDARITFDNRRLKRFKSAKHLAISKLVLAHFHVQHRPLSAARHAGYNAEFLICNTGIGIRHC